DATIIECSVTEKIRFSGTRQIVVPIPDSTVQVQQLGTVEARRVITGYVRAATETVALGWVKRQKTLAFGAQSVGTGLPVAPTVYYDEPAEIEIVNQFAKRVDGDARGTDAARTPAMITVNFTFSQIIPYYPYQIS
ncbi:MAG TPA: hypothetical protein VNU68_32515, partial [Verrucomicrobiae bacterium]|nr:hypothetical protein [Verrucomicrobiae bacterium]